MTIRVLQFICPSGYYGAERWVNALLSVAPSQQIEHHLAITDEPGVSDEVLKRCGLSLERQHRITMSSKFDLRAVVRLVKLIKTHKIDIIHTHGYKSDILGVLASKWAGIASVCTPHGFENAEDWKLKLYMWLGGKAFHGFTWVCPLSPDIMNTVISKYRVNSQRVRLINNGVDLAEVEKALANKNSKAKSLFTIGYIGQLISRKNLGATIDAFAALHRRYPTTELVLIGDGDERTKLELQVNQLQLNGAVKFLGFRDDRLSFLPEFDCFVMTSSLEGIPRCLMEAMAAKVCVTAFDIPGVNELIKDSKTGLLSKFNHAQELAESWIRLIEQPALKLQLAEAGHKYVYEHFSATAMERDYTRLYLEIVEE